MLLSNEWNTIINDAAKRAAAVLGLPYSSTTFNLNDGTAVTQAQSAAAAGAKLFLIVSADGSSLKRIARTAQEGGGYVVNVGNNIPGHLRLTPEPALRRQSLRVRTEIAAVICMKPSNTPLAWR